MQIAKAELSAICRAVGVLAPNDSTDLHDLPLVIHVKCKKWPDTGDISNEVKEIDGVCGVHVMAYRQEEFVAEIVAESGILKGRRPWRRELRPEDVIVAEKLDHMLHDDEPHSPVEMVNQVAG